MSTMFSHGMLLAILVTVWTAIVIASGWHKDPVLLNLFLVAVPIQATVLVLAIRERAEANYGRRVWTGVGTSLVGGVLIALGSALLTSIVFPHYFQEIRAAGEAFFAKQGKSPEEIAAMSSLNARSYSSWSYALQGFAGTLLAGLLLSVLAAAWIRKR